MRKPRLVAIVNVTPDSFSDGGAHFTPANAIAAIERFAADGADVVDIGAESTRPGAAALTAAEEWARLEPVLAALPQTQAIISVDTRHAQTARKALEYGVRWINDVSGFADPEMLDAVRRSGCMLVVMHSLSVPADKNIVMPEHCDVVSDIAAFAAARITALEKAGIARERIIFDPGIGFGKTAAQSLALLRGIDVLRALGVPLLVGHSRKSFLSAFGDRDAATLAVSQFLAGEGVDYLRVHDVTGHRQLFSVMEALYG